MEQEFLKWSMEIFMMDNGFKELKTVKELIMKWLQK